MDQPHSARRGATLVEVLTVVAIIGVLCGLLLGSVQRVRLAAARTQCVNNLRQVGLSWHSHATVHGYFPTGGALYLIYPVTFDGPGSPPPGGLRPTDQVAGWMYQVLPYIDQEPLWRQSGAADKFEACAAVLRTPVPTYFCPGRGRPRTWEPPLDVLGRPVIGTVRAGNDYAANGGLQIAIPSSTGITQKHNGMLGSTGWFTPGNLVRPADVTDGLANTLMIAERRIPTADYAGPNNFNMYGYVDARGGETATGGGDDRGPFLPLQDRLTGGHPPLVQGFGAVHAEGLPSVMADGSVRIISYSADPWSWYYSCSRNDGRPSPLD